MVIQVSDFDALFNELSSIGLSALRDSSIKLVTQYDYPYLKTGEYFYDEKNNILYVGAGNVADIYDVLSFIERLTSFKLIESPKIKVYLEVEDSIERFSNFIIKESTKVNNEVSISVDNYLSASFRISNKFNFNISREYGEELANIERRVNING